MRNSRFIGALVFVLSAASSLLADEAAIEAVLTQMEKAVLAGNQAAYLANVSSDDPIFRKEQENWAADFDHFVPVEFDLSIYHPPADSTSEPADGKDDKKPHFGDSEARFELVTTWRLTAEKRERKVSFPAIFRFQGANGGPGGWHYCGEDWVVLQPEAEKDSPAGGGTRCMCFPGFEKAAQAVVSVLPDIRKHVDEGFETTNPDLVEVKIYPNMRHLQHSIYLSYEDGLAGWNEPGESIKVLAGPRDGEAHFRPLLAHEYGHVDTFRMGPKANDMAWWILEGVAELSAESYTQDSRMVKGLVLRWYNRNELAPWDEMADFRKTPGKYMHHVYKQGQHMLGFISEKWQRSGRNKWLSAMAGGKTLEEATQEVLGVSFTELNKLWRDSISLVPPVNPDANAPAPEPAPAAAPTKD